MIKRERGRPEISNERKKSYILNVRIDQELFDYLYYIRKTTGMNNSDIVRKSIEMLARNVMNGR